MVTSFNKTFLRILFTLLKDSKGVNLTSAEVTLENLSLTSNSNATTKGDVDHGALLYIVTVLMFYSAGIVVMIVKYLITEKRELEQEQVLESFFRSMPDTKSLKEDHVNKVAIRAFHTLTSFSINEKDEEEKKNSDEEEEMFVDTEMDRNEEDEEISLRKHAFEI
ncbi:hypothetical protein CHS0354_022420 [Potamilus streckersoni]|uniref:Uncharacterized protein n=1 Tax=Potamilus streckersoni TaxID=2493646 RepID=A0AAE0W2N8_9BIVA|nr:hypothetical protein CHS0354_022420 [Potamilus streckersoni]